MIKMRSCKMRASATSRFICLFLLLACASCMLLNVGRARAQRDERDQDDFDDAGFDDSGYNSPQAHDAESSQHNPSSYSPASEEDLDDDDDVDESSQVAKVAANGPRQFFSPANSIVMPIAMGGRQKRSVEAHQTRSETTKTKEHDEQEADVEQVAESRPLVRKRRYSKHYIGPVYTYVKTDKHAHYKWGVKHKVGKHLG